MQERLCRIEAEDRHCQVHIDLGLNLRRRFEFSQIDEVIVVADGEVRPNRALTLLAEEDLSETTLAVRRIDQTDARGEIILIRRHQPARHGVADGNAGGDQRCEFSRLPFGNQHRPGGKIKRPLLVEALSNRDEEFVADSKIQSQSGSYFVVILNVEGINRTAIVDVVQIRDVSAAGQSKQKLRKTRTPSARGRRIVCQRSVEKEIAAHLLDHHEWHGQNVDQREAELEIRESGLVSDDGAEVVAAQRIQPAEVVEVRQIARRVSGEQTRGQKCAR